MSAPRPDVIVVGAGPAGAATAILLAEHGLHALVLERGGRVRPKICGEYLSPEAGRVLDRLGVLKTVESAGAVALDQDDTDRTRAPPRPPHESAGEAAGAAAHVDDDERMPTRDRARGAADARQR